MHDQHTKLKSNKMLLPQIEVNKIVITVKTYLNRNLLQFYTIIHHLIKAILQIYKFNI